MPYTTDSPNLPANVKKMSAKRKDQWLGVFNSCLKSSKPESDCFAIANGVAKKEISEKDFEEILAEGEKCGWDAPVYMEPYRPYGGATSFAEADAYHLAQETSDEIYQAKSMFDNIYRNISEDDMLTSEQKIAAMSQASADMISRIQAAPTEASTKEEIGVKGKIRNLLFGEKRIFSAEERKKLAKSGTAMSDGSYPIANEQDLKNAIRAIGRAKNPTGAKAHIKKRAVALGLTKLLPDTWSTKEEVDNFFLITKDIEGDYRWLAIFSNKFEDREKEILSEDSHKEFEQWVDSSKQYPELRMWHIPGTDIGMVDMVTYADGFQIAAGYFYPETKEVAESLAKCKDLGVSHGYAYAGSDLNGGIYKRYRTFEISVLPGARAANSWTAFTLEQLQQEVNMGLRDDKRDFLVQHFGEERVTKLETLLPTLSKELEESGIGWKDLAEAMEDPVAAADPTPPDPSPPAPVPITGAITGTDAIRETAEEAAKDPSEAAAVKELLSSSISTAVREAMAPFAAAVVELQTEVKGLKRTDDEKIAAALAPKTNVKEIVGAAVRPSETANTLDPEDPKVKALDIPDEERQEGGNVAASRRLVENLLGGKQ